MAAWIPFPLAYLAAGVLAEKVYEPLLSPNGLLSSSVGLVIGVGPGRGIGAVVCNSRTIDYGSNSFCIPVCAIAIRGKESSRYVY
jgi:hypothetical protein